MIDAKEVSAAHRARYFWGNLPGMNRLVSAPGPRGLWVGVCKVRLVRVLPRPAFSAECPLFCHVLYSLSKKGNLDIENTCLEKPATRHGGAYL